MEPVSANHINKAKPIGTIVEVHSPVVLIHCDTLPPLRQALTTRNRDRTYTFEVYQRWGDCSG